MIIVDYKKSHHRQVIRACVLALKQGKILAYPTDTCYGLAADAENFDAIRKLYRVKGRNFNKPIHVVVPSLLYAKKIAKWNKLSSGLAKKFWPRLRQGYGGQAGPLTIVLPLKAKGEGYRLLSAGNGTIGLRMPNNRVALDLSRSLKRPITATSANVSGKKDSYGIREIINQFKNQKYRPDIIINFGKLPKRKPSTVVKIDNNQIQILRSGPVTQKQILNVLQA